ncbi:MAG: serine/threonine-protein kinase [Archangium sp.]|nr:serine/threonine-protein kinase [Archangium sp.]MDP3569144.1 serine/threonine-protein kinase [Archangium sp.]
MSPHPLVPDPLIGQNVGGYLVEEALGEGAVGLVYRARHPTLNRHFAIKVLRPEIAVDVTSSRNFAREAQTLASLKHPSIINIIDFGPMSGGRQYMVMEFLLGKTLERELLEEGRLEPERALRISDEILDALSAAHSVGVIHRDLKPSNVFLEKISGGREVVKLLDFGLAKQRPAVLGLQTGPLEDTSIAGTPEYIAPEQACGQAASRQSDLYSFGVVLFRMLTGSLPFKADLNLPDNQQVLALMKQHVHQAPPTLHEAAAGVQFPEGLSEIVADLLKKLPGDRPSSAETARKRLSRAQRSLQQEATQARPNPLLTVPLVKKKRSSGWLVAVTLMLVILPGAAWWFGRAAPVAAIVLPPPIAAPSIAPVVLEEEPPPPVDEPLEELLGLSRIVRAKKRVAAPLPAIVLAAPACAPDDDWKKRARADLNELMTRAAKSSPELTLWAADREGPLSAAIEGATSEPDCRVVGLQLESLKEKVSRR